MSGAPARYATLITAEQLAGHVNDSDYAIVDCRHSLADYALGRRLYDESHVPGAFFAGVETALAGEKTGRNGRHPLPDRATFVQFLRGLGIGERTQIVAYDAGGDMFAARMWLLCRWIGHEASAVLDGGFTAWLNAGYPVTDGAPAARRAGNIVAQPDPGFIVDAAYVLAHLENDAMHLLDARAADRFAGENETIDPVAGHIPGARNRWFKHNFNYDGTFKSPEVLRADFAARAADPARIVHSCGSGVSAAANYLAMMHAGMPGSRVYAGSWSEWIADPSRPIATGPESAEVVTKP